jgi:hypothetical protein
MTICFLIDASEQCAAARYARLRGALVAPCEKLDALPAQISQSSMIAMSCSRLQQLSSRRRAQIANLVGQGATLYVRGLPQGCAALDLKPFVPTRLAIASERRATSYRFTASRMLPAALAGEQVSGGLFEACAVEDPTGSIEQLLVVRHVDGIERSAILALGYGGGCAIFDLQAENGSGTETPIAARLADRDTLCREIGALIAANRLAAIDSAQIPPFNLTIDDRPVNFDHFNAQAISALLRHIDRLCPGAHTDFAWTPRHTSPCRGYLEVMKKFPTGFVWHGLYRHVDHRALAHPALELAKGARMIRRLQRRFGIRFQPVMIFPFERSAPGQYPLLVRAGFTAVVGEPGPMPGSDPDLPGYLAGSLPAHTDVSSGLTVLYRYPAAALTRERMLAMAALGLPIIAAAHPDEVGLKRLSRFWDRGGNVAHFDEVLKFASSKGLLARSLEEITLEVRGTQQLAGVHMTRAVRAAAGS